MSSGAMRGPWRSAALLLALCLGGAVAEETRAYRGLWGGLFRQQASATAAAAEDRLRQALADAAAWLHPLHSQSGVDGAEGAANRASLFHHLPSSLEALLEHLATHVLGNQSDATTNSTIHALLDRLDGAQLAATVATVQAWALTGLLTGGDSSNGNGLSGSSLAGGLPYRQVKDPSWASFRPHTCMRLQNLGNAEGYSAALLGPAPCATGSLAPAHAAAATVSGEALRWGSQAAFTLDCSRGNGEDGGADASSPGATPSTSTLSSALHAAASKAAASVAAAWERSSTCRLSLSSDSGGGALLEYPFERPLLGGLKLDALRIRVCNSPPSTSQYPAALAHGGATIALSSLKLNGHPLLTAPLLTTQAAAADGCLLQLYRLPSRATHTGYVLSGLVRLVEGSSGDGSSLVGGSGGGFGVGEMASVELTLGEFSMLNAATSRLLGGATAQRRR